MHSSLKDGGIIFTSLFCFFSWMAKKKIQQARSFFRYAFYARTTYQSKIHIPPQATNIAPTPPHNM